MVPERKDAIDGSAGQTNSDSSAASRPLHELPTDGFSEGSFERVEHLVHLGVSLAVACEPKGCGTNTAFELLAAVFDESPHALESATRKPGEL
jgi:hypothetical protein